MSGVWKPRASAIGSYMRCEWRAVHDRLIFEGKIPAPQRDPSESAGYASLGNCGHFVLQDGLRCQFGPRDVKNIDLDKVMQDGTVLGREEKEFAEYCDEFFAGDLDATIAAYKSGDPKIYQPLPSEWQEAATLFGGNMELTQQKVRDTATLAAAKVPKTPDNKPWLCETSLENEYLTGHTDFLSQCYTQVGDLKTTAKPPNHGWIKYEHLAQLAAYHLLTGCKQTWILYVDSMRAMWATLIWVDWTQPGKKAYAEQVEAYCKYLMSDAVFEHAIPRIGSHCSETWCPYRKICYQEMMPPPGIVFDVNATKKLSGQLTWGGKVMGA